MADSVENASTLAGEFINLLLETKYYDFAGDRDSITPESCRQAIEDYSGPFSWTDARKMSRFLRSVEGMPSELVSAACLFAWGQIDWELIAKSVREEGM